MNSVIYSVYLTHLIYWAKRGRDGRPWDQVTPRLPPLAAFLSLSALSRRRLLLLLLLSWCWSNEVGFPQLLTNQIYFFNDIYRNLTITNQIYNSVRTRRISRENQPNTAETENDATQKQTWKETDRQTNSHTKWLTEGKLDGQNKETFRQREHSEVAISLDVRQKRSFHLKTKRSRFCFNFNHKQTGFNCIWSKFAGVLVTHLKTHYSLNDHRH